MGMIIDIIIEAWRLLLESAPYVVFGLLISGLLRVFINPAYVSRHLGSGRFTSVLKASLIGIPMPLCSCGVLPAAVSLRKQGANKGATTAFLISTPETGADSIAISYALLDPMITVARPVAAFITAICAGLIENWTARRTEGTLTPDLTCPVDTCCTGIDCLPHVHSGHHTFPEKVRAGVRFALTDVWADIAGWFMLGLLLAGLITALVPEHMVVQYLGGGLVSMLLMLAAGVPLYICATASTPIAAALILKGVSPGVALVFLLAGPATNITSLTVLLGVMGKRTTAIYLGAISVASLAFGLALDQAYAAFGISAKAVLGQAADIIPPWLEWACALALLALSVKPLSEHLQARMRAGKTESGKSSGTDTAFPAPPLGGCKGST
jgi:uncharacterized membrane protein YraQ (UPF0718 family)